MHNERQVDLGSSRALLAIDLKFCHRQNEDPCQCLVIETGAGSFIGDITINGDLIGLYVGYEHLTFRNMTITNYATVLDQIWNFSVSLCAEASLAFLRHIHRSA